MSSETKRITIYETSPDPKNIRVSQLCYYFNSSQLYYYFKSERRSLPQDIIQTGRRADILAAARDNIDSTDLLSFFILDTRDENGWYITYPENKVSLVFPYGWEQITDEVEVSCLIGSFIIQVLQAYEYNRDNSEISQLAVEQAFHDYQKSSSESPGGMRLLHFETHHCLNDFCAHKPDALLKIRTGNLCPDCLQA
jgi:hypothetical protein